MDEHHRIEREADEAFIAFRKKWPADEAGDPTGVELWHHAWRAAVAFERERGHGARRWISTHAPRIEALEGLLRAAQIEAHAGREAVASLASERAANAMLTDEVERLRVHAVTLAETARQVEQERCAMICEALTSRSSEYDAATMDCAAAIRGPNVGNNPAAVGSPVSEANEG